ncbi:hypothetical protein RJ641_003626 [Dillenia turbinata]|uniref:Uncharacterized protein n=1 Tax=Dillenia turbinata TaxID=194707 RepID=A0AAN8ZFD4_9MAGN
MDSTLKLCLITPIVPSPRSSLPSRFGLKPNQFKAKVSAVSLNGSSPSGADSNSTADVHRKKSSLESLFCYDKSIPEERIEKPIGLSLAEKRIGGNPRCTDCGTKGAVLCTTCSGSGLYVDAILESQGIIVKVRCLGCGGTGNVMCSECGGRGHLGPH